MSGRTRTVAVLLLWVTIACRSPARADDVGRIAGRVEDAAGAAVVRADVRLTRLDPTLGAMSYSATRGAWSGDDGGFEFTAVAAGAWLVEARDGERWQRIPLRIVISDDAPIVDDAVLHVESAGFVIGEVKDPSGRPIEGVGVAVGDGGLQGKDIEPVTLQDHATGELVHLKRGLRYPRLPLAVTHTDALGRFRLAPVLPDRPIVLRVGGLPPFHDRTAECPPAGGDGPAMISITLERAAAVIGRVVDEHARPLLDARVTLRALERHPAKAGWVVLPRESRAADDLPSTVLLAGADGLFRFDGLLPGHYLVLAVADGHASGTSAVLAVTRVDEVLETVISLGAGAALDGVVIDSSGAPCADALVRVLADSSVSGDLFPFLDPIEARTAPNGRFRIAGLAVGSTITLSIEAASGIRIAHAGVVAAANGADRPLEVRLPHAAAGAAFIAAAAQRPRRSPRAVTPPARSTRP